VGASSINAFGFFYGDRGFPIRYLPVDEAHEGVATDAYSFSKQVMEDIGRYFWERAGISGVMLRLPAVLSQERFDAYLDHSAPARETAERLLALPDSRREAEIMRLSRAYDTWRREHRWDKIDREELRRMRDEEVRGGLSRAEFALMSSRANLFTYVHEDDSAQAIEKGLTAEYEGSHPLYINVHRNTLGLPVEEMAKLFDPPMPEIRAFPPGDTTVLSIGRARELLGFEPELIAER
jgi:nucleoside-diphosphate-sugar epimerase